MQINKLNNIIFLKNTESNIIEEAFVVLKENIKLNEYIHNEEYKNEKNNNIDILKEAEILVNSKIDESNIKYEKFRLKKIEKKYKRLKILNLILIISVLIEFIIT